MDGGYKEIAGRTTKCVMIALQVNRMFLRDHKENSQLYWWPKVWRLPIPLPKTVLVDADYELKHGLEEAAEEIGYPLFLRTDFTSLKHSWEESALVTKPEDLPTHAGLLRMDSAFQDLPVNAFVLRELLPLETGWISGKRGMPVHKERRFFVRDGRIECQHPYWTEEVIKTLGGPALPAEVLAKKVSDITSADAEQLINNAGQVAGAIAGYWSADFARSVDGKWYLLDMAMGEDSFHLEDCQFREKV